MASYDLTKIVSKVFKVSYGFSPLLPQDHCLLSLPNSPNTALRRDRRTLLAPVTGRVVPIEHIIPIDIISILSHFDICIDRDGFREFGTRALPLGERKISRRHYHRGRPWVPSRLGTRTSSIWVDPLGRAALVSRWPSSRYMYNTEIRGSLTLTR